MRLLIFVSLVVACLAVIPVDLKNKKIERWINIGVPDADDSVTLHIALKQQNLDLLEATLYDVSTPSSPNYGKHLTHEQVNEMIRPTQETYKTVRQWLVNAGVSLDNVEEHVDFMVVKTKVSIAENLMAAKYKRYVHLGSNQKAIRSEVMEIPAHIAEHVDIIGPSTRFPNTHRPKIVKLDTEIGVTPAKLQELYKTTGIRGSHEKTQQCVTGFLEQYIDEKDYQKFLSQYDPKSKILSGDIPVNIVGPDTMSKPGVEAILDIEYVAAMGPDVNTTFWSTAGRNPDSPENEPFLVFLQNLAATPNPPTVISISYGDNEPTIELDYANRVSVEFQKAGVRGISLMASSGDGGVGGGQPSACKKFIPTFPAACPYITAVGGSTGSNPEKAAGLSSGGFSNYYARPSYQQDVVPGYFKVAQNIPDSSLYNQTSAGFPDVAVQAEGFEIVIHGLTTAVSGTSCSSPSFAGIVALLNDIRLVAGKSTLGWLNPLLYANPDAFNDVTTGSNPGCMTKGFQAAKGWDPVTGLGTPNYEKLAAIVKNLP